MENPYGKDYIDLPLAELGVRLAHDVNRILRLEPGLKVSIFKEHAIKGGMEYQKELQDLTEDVFHFTDPIQRLTSPNQDKWGSRSPGGTSFANPLGADSSPASVRESTRRSPSPILPTESE
jgi:hypothetical protein